MAKNVANIIYQKIVEERNVYMFNDKLYVKSENTSFDKFVEHIISENHDKCQEIIVKQKIIFGYQDYEVLLIDFELTKEKYYNLLQTLEHNYNFITKHGDECVLGIEKRYIYKLPPKRKSGLPTLCNGNCYTFDDGDSECNFCANRNVPLKDEECDDYEKICAEWCTFCKGFIDKIDEVDRFCYCRCKNHFEECDTSSITVVPKVMYKWMDHNYIKDDIYKSFKYCGINVCKKGLIDIIKKMIIPKKLNYV